MKMVSISLHCTASRSIACARASANAEGTGRRGWVAVELRHAYLDGGCRSACAARVPLLGRGLFWRGPSPCQVATPSVMQHILCTLLLLQGPAWCERTHYQHGPLWHNLC
jgi:hypothetical protein